MASTRGAAVSLMHFVLRLAQRRRPPSGQARLVVAVVAERTTPPSGSERLAQEARKRRLRLLSSGNNSYNHGYKLGVTGGRAKPDDQRIPHRRRSLPTRLGKRAISRAERGRHELAPRRLDLADLEHPRPSPPPAMAGPARASHSSVIEVASGAASM